MLVKLAGLAAVLSSVGNRYHSLSWASAQSCRARNEQAAVVAVGVGVGVGVTPAVGGALPPLPPPPPQAVSMAMHPATSASLWPRIKNPRLVNVLRPTSLRARV